MPRFFCDAIAGGKAVITGEDAAHIARSLRMQPGERLTLSDGQGTDFDCVLDLVTPQEVFLTVLESYPACTEPSVYVRLYMAMPRLKSWSSRPEGSGTGRGRDHTGAHPAVCVPSRPQEL